MYKSGVHCVIRHMWSAHMRRTVVCQMIRDDNYCRWWARYWNIMLEKVFNDTIERQKMQWAQHVQYQIMIGGTYVKIHVVKTCIIIHVGTNYFKFFLFLCLHFCFLPHYVMHVNTLLVGYDLELVTWSIRNAISD